MSTPGEAKTYPCLYCTVVFKHSKSFDRHLRKAHADIVEAEWLPCEICPKKYRTPQLLSLHVKSAHSEKRKRELDEERPKKLKVCPFCHKEIYEHRRFLIHANKLHPEEVREHWMPCDECDLYIPNAESLFSHKARVHGNSESVRKSSFSHTQCEFCPKILSRAYIFFKHASLHHTDIVAALWLKCDRCENAYFPTAKSLEMHHFTAHELKNRPKTDESKRHLCNYCPMTLSSTFCYYKHCNYRHKTDIVKEWVSCETCNLYFPTGEILMQHKASAHRDAIKHRIFPCGYCSASFTTRNRFIQHVNNKHPDDCQRDWVKCQLCDNGFFPSERALRYHTSALHSNVFVHPDVKEKRRARRRQRHHRCEFCPRVMISYMTYITHVNREHSEEASKVWKECNLCNHSQYYPNDGALKRHFTALHKEFMEPDNSKARKKSNYMCEKCNIKFWKISDLAAHSNEVHKEDIDDWRQCPHCELKFPTPRSLCQHGRSVHNVQIDWRVKGVDTVVKEERYECSFCGDKFTKLYMYVDHANELHFNQIIKSWECCDECGRYFPTRRAMLRHRRLTHNRRVKDDNYYEEDSEEEEEAKPLTRLVKRESTSTKEACNYCRAKFPNKELLTTHLKAKHPDTFLSRWKMCPHCTTCYLPSEEAMARHVQTCSLVPLTNIKLEVIDLDDGAFAPEEEEEGDQEELMTERNEDIKPRIAALQEALNRAEANDATGCSAQDDVANAGEPMDSSDQNDDRMNLTDKDLSRVEERVDSSDPKDVNTDSSQPEERMDSSDLRTEKEGIPETRNEPEVPVDPTERTEASEKAARLESVEGQQESVSEKPNPSRPKPCNRRKLIARSEVAKRNNDEARVGIAEGRERKEWKVEPNADLDPLAIVETEVESIKAIPPPIIPKAELEIRDVRIELESIDDLVSEQLEALKMLRALRPRSSGKPKCRICRMTFATKSSLTRHNRNKHRGRSDGEDSDEEENSELYIGSPLAEEEEEEAVEEGGDDFVGDDDVSGLNFEDFSALGAEEEGDIGDMLELQMFEPDAHMGHRQALDDYEEEEEEEEDDDENDSNFEIDEDSNDGAGKRTGGRRKRLPLNCDVCGKRFAKRWNLALHRRRVHRDHDPADCEICGKQFRSRERLSIHRRNIHRKRGETEPQIKIKPDPDGDGDDDDDADFQNFDDDLSLGENGDVRVKDEPEDEDDEEQPLRRRRRRRVGEKRPRSSVAVNEEGGYVCDLCGKISNSVRNINRHKRRFHKIDQPETGERKQRTPKPFTFRSALEAAISSQNIDETSLALLSKLKENSSSSGGGEGGDGEVTKQEGGGGDEGAADPAAAPLAPISEALEVLKQARRPYQCEECGRAFIRNSHLKSHMITHNKTTTIAAFECPHCDKKFQWKTNLEIHVRAVHDKVRFKCDECDKHFSSRHYLQEHTESVHLKSQACICELCGAHFNTHRALKRHIPIAHLNQSFECHDCGKKFGDAAVLKRHIIGIHLKDGTQEERTYNCDQCGKTFGHSHVLKRHIKFVHRKEKDFSCEICGGLFFDKNSLRHHKQAVHLKLKPHVCEHCGKRYSESHALKRHVNVEHTKEFTFKCNICGEAFLERRMLKRHLERHGVAPAAADASARSMSIKEDEDDSEGAPNERYFSPDNSNSHFGSPHGHPHGPPNPAGPPAAGAPSSSYNLPNHGPHV